MSDLSELLPGPKQVEIDGKKYAVNGLSLAEFAILLSRFPALKQIFAGTLGDVDAGELLRAGNPAVAAIIAAGCGKAADEQWEKNAAALPAQYQVKFLAPIVSLTMPRGFGPFAEDLATVLRTLFPPTPDQIRDKALAKVMRKQSQLSSNAGAAPMKPSGNSRPDSSPPTGS
jgi:hypothetical protein